MQKDTHFRPSKTDKNLGGLVAGRGLELSSRLWNTSHVPRPLPAFSVARFNAEILIKSWEWPGDEACHEIFGPPR